MAAIMIAIFGALLALGLACLWHDRPPKDTPKPKPPSWWEDNQ